MMIFAVNAYKKANGGYISLGKGMGVTYLTGLLMAVVSMIISLAIILIFGVQVPDAINSPELVDSYSKMSSFGPLLLASLFSMSLGCAVGAVIAFIISLVTKKERPFKFNTHSKTH